MLEKKVEAFRAWLDKHANAEPPKPATAQEIAARQVEREHRSAGVTYAVVCGLILVVFVGLGVWAFGALFGA